MVNGNKRSEWDEEARGMGVGAIGEEELGCVDKRKIEVWE